MSKLLDRRRRPAPTQQSLLNKKHDNSSDSVLNSSSHREEQWGDVKWYIHDTASVSTAGKDMPSRVSLERLSTMEEIEIIATEQGGREGSLLLLPTQGDMDDESSVDSSLSTADLNDEDDDDEAHGYGVEQLQANEEFVVLTDSTRKREFFRLIRFSRTPKQRQLLKEVDVEAYMARREMTVTQERWNALTMIPNPVYCLYFLLSGEWVSADYVEAARASLVTVTSNPRRFGRLIRGFGGLANDVVGDVNGCLDEQWWHNMPALPPLPVVAVCIGICAHAPFSFLYHWKYAHTLPPGLARTNHWSRRLDQSMIHFCSALLAYATSGSWDFFVANVFFNLDCMARHFQSKVRPRRNKIRIAISVLAYTVPILKRGDMALFGKLWLILAVSGWLFGTYPIGGWSHSAFHLVIALMPPLLMRAACDLGASQEQMRLAAQCVASRNEIWP